MGKLADIPPEALELIESEASGLVDYNIDLDYTYWTAGWHPIGTLFVQRNSCCIDEILHVFLPEELREGAPSGFAMVGHIGMGVCASQRRPLLKRSVAHLNLNDEYLPYKHIIGQVILDVAPITLFSAICC